MDQRGDDRERQLVRTWRCTFHSWLDQVCCEQTSLPSVTRTTLVISAVPLIACFRGKPGGCLPIRVNISHWRSSSLPASSGLLGQPLQGHPAQQTICNYLLQWLGASQTALQPATSAPHSLSPHLLWVQPRLQMLTRMLKWPQESKFLVWYDQLYAISITLLWECWRNDYHTMIQPCPLPVYKPPFGIEI